MIRVLLTGLLVTCSPLAAAEWRVLPEFSAIQFETAVSYPVGDPPQALEGSLPVLRGSVAYDPATPAAASLDVLLDMSRITVGDMGLDQDLKSANWLGVRRHANARLTAKGFRNTGPGSYITQADLALRGKVRAVPIRFDVSITQGQAIATGTTELDRFAFNIGPRVPETVTPRMIPIRFRIAAAEYAD